MQATNELPIEVFLRDNKVCIPDPEVIRERIGANIRERQLLRRLLKLSLQRSEASRKVSQ
ncbi:MAG: hypothetical protein K8T91_07000 [Planctomycetes bacterium]|nr:hypothetical protein [Planctomycetota bacterium]